MQSRSRAYLLLKQHGQITWTRTRPACDSCPVNTSCAFMIERDGGQPVGARSGPRGRPARETLIAECIADIRRRGGK